MDFEPKLYDSEGKEVILKPGHVWLMGKEEFCQVPINTFEAKLVYKPPADDESEALKCEYGSTSPVLFRTSNGDYVYLGDDNFVKSLEELYGE